MYCNDSNTTIIVVVFEAGVLAPAFAFNEDRENEPAAGYDELIPPFENL
jgi:hypothetical protein